MLGTEHSVTGTPILGSPILTVSAQALVPHLPFTVLPCGDTPRSRCPQACSLWCQGSWGRESP